MEGRSCEYCAGIYVKNGGSQVRAIVEKVDSVDFEKYDKICINVVLFVLLKLLFLQYAK